MIGLHVTTLGCKLNQFDTAELAGSLRGAARPVADPSSARLIVINTCTVTAAADAEARRLVRRRRRESPGALIVATGCYAERDPEALRALPEVDLVLGRGDRPAAAGILIEELRRRFPAELADGCAQRGLEERLPDFGDRSRAFLRVQEGCDLVCTYCVIPAVRGPSVSVPPDGVEAAFRRLIAAGYREVVLTGVNTGDYGRDLAPSCDLPALLDRLTRVQGDFRIRLNSVEPRRVTPELVERLASEPKLARHLQVPLQSGSDAVLRAMRRNYRVRDYLLALDRLHRRVPGIGLGADVIVGFPGEDGEAFEATLRAVEASPLSYLHVFPWSERPGTAAASLPGRVHPEEARRRGEALRAVGELRSLAFRRGQVGLPQRALTLKGRRGGGATRAVTSNFIDVTVEGEFPENRFLDVVIREVSGSINRAAPLDERAPAG
ncbi:MAG TPA: tRNA (N(6)-L-threonylcarbamoyladenosine(37)-C(2))-methylthiotransferase MtaB [Candidatus Polarisedimenticolia bacterium]|nr:tRNA (N(6)-L-threonylcarbamoyladenosine(37)-C(2))-methylthiotransferase MtaB [Candidatus Polarisedimenticolia bacterium]